MRDGLPVPAGLRTGPGARRLRAAAGTGPAVAQLGAPPDPPRPAGRRAPDPRAPRPLRPAAPAGAAGIPGPVFATGPTAEIARIVMLDSARIQVEDVEHKRYRHEKKGRTPPRQPVPLYTEQDAERAGQRFTVVELGRTVRVADGVEAEFFEAGHILGSSSIRVRAGGGSRGAHRPLLGRHRAVGQALPQRSRALRRGRLGADGIDLRRPSARDRGHDRGRAAGRPERGGARGGQRRHPELRHRALAGAALLPQPAAAGEAGAPRARVPRQPHGDPGDGGLLPSSGLPRRRDAGPPRARRLPVRPAEPRDGADRRRVEGDQRHPGHRDHHRRLGHVHRRAHQAPPRAQPPAPRVHGAVRGLPGQRHPRPGDPRGGEERAHPRRPGARCAPGWRGSPASPRTRTATSCCAGPRRSTTKPRGAFVVHGEPEVAEGFGRTLADADGVADLGALGRGLGRPSPST